MSRIFEQIPNSEKWEIALPAPQLVDAPVRSHK